MNRSAYRKTDDEPTLRIVPAPAIPWNLRRRLQPGEVLAGRYRLCEEVGRGGMGVVYRAVDEQLGVGVALKVLRPELADDPRLVERFRREIIAARQVSHRNAVRIHDIGRDGDLLFLTMDFVEGQSLQALLRKEKRLAPQRAADIARQLALALEAAHEVGIIHRDLKPGNILVEPSGHAWITDFGLARSPGAHDLTRTGMIVGTPAYLSPEQARGEPVDRLSDLYALGLLLFEMLTGELPAPETISPPGTGALRDLRTLGPAAPPYLRSIVRRLLDPDTARRFQSAGEVVAALDRRRAPSLLSRRPLLSAALALLVLTALLAATWGILPRNRPASPRSSAAAPLEAPITTSSPVALRGYQEGLEHLVRREDAVAAPFLERSVAADPGFTAAWIALARVRSSLGQSREALQAARRAVASLGPRSGRFSWEARALEARLRGEPQKAREILTELVARAPQDVEARVDLAEACGEAGDLRAAIAELRRVVAMAPDHPRAWYLLAKHSILAGDSRRAADEYLMRAMVIQDRLGSEAGKAEVHNALGVAYNDLGELDQAAESYKTAAAIRRRIGDQRGLAATLRNLASVDAVRGEHERAEERLAEAMSIVERLGDLVGQADVSNDLGLLAEERGSYEEAMEHYRRGLQLRRRLGQTLPLAESLNNVGYMCYLLARFDDATVYWQQALGLFRQGGDDGGVVLGTQEIGLIQTAQGDWSQARASFLEAIDASRKLGLKQATAAGLIHRGRLELLQGRFLAAFASFEQALPLLRELGDVRGQTELALAEAETWLQAGNLETARQCLDTAERLLAGTPNGEQRSDLLRLRGEWHMQRGETAAAREALQQAMTAAQASHGVVALLQSRIARARLGGSRKLPELRALRTEIGAIGHRGLELAVTEALAEAALAGGQVEEAEAAARQGLEAVQESGAWSGAFRLHLLLAQTLDRRGLLAEAAGERERAAADLARLRSNLTPGQRPWLDALARAM
ncbi:MAG TPA: tetratricopeptide repeat protein [Thermoanaerobaculia bacterium]|nr:tetratricopeptide repeat protein [Thermoanaerobaculia bacterium]